MEVGRAVDQGQIILATDLVEERAEARLGVPAGFLGHRNVVPGRSDRPGDQVYTGDARRLDDPLGDRVPGVDRGDRLGRIDRQGNRRPPQTLSERGLRVVIDEEHPPAKLGERPGQVVAGRGLADPALLVQQRDRGQGSLRGLAVARGNGRFYP